MRHWTWGRPAELTLSIFRTELANDKFIATFQGTELNHCPILTLQALEIFYSKYKKVLYECNLKTQIAVWMAIK